MTKAEPNCSSGKTIVFSEKIHEITNSISQLCDPAYLSSTCVIFCSERYVKFIVLLSIADLSFGPYSFHMSHLRILFPEDETPGVSNMSNVMTLYG